MHNRSPEPSEHLRGEEIDAYQDGHLRADEIGPTRLLATVLGGVGCYPPFDWRPVAQIMQCTRDAILTSEMFAEDGQSGPLRISQQQADSQMDAQDSILRQQVFILQQKLLIHHPGHVRYQAHHLCFLHRKRTIIRSFL